MGMGIDWMGMGGNWNAKSHCRSSLVQRQIDLTLMSPFRLFNKHSDNIILLFLTLDET